MLLHLGQLLHLGLQHEYTVILVGGEIMKPANKTEGNL